MTENIPKYLVASIQSYFELKTRPWANSRIFDAFLKLTKNCEKLHYDCALQIVLHYCIHLMPSSPH